MTYKEMQEIITKTRDLKHKIKGIKTKISNTEEHIARIINDNNKDKIQLQKFILELEKLEFDKKSEKKENKPIPIYKNFDNCKNENIGLYNTTVLFPVAKCNLHKCYLDYQNVRKRKCVMRMCKNFEWVQDESNIY